MTITYNQSTFSSVMLVTFNFNNGVKTFWERKEAERVEISDGQLLVVTADGEWIYWPEENVNNLQIQTLIRADYHE